MIFHALLEKLSYFNLHMGHVKQICIFEHSVMTNFNYACPVIQRGQGSGFLSEGSFLLTACMNAARIGDKYQIRLTRPMCTKT